MSSKCTNVAESIYREDAAHCAFYAVKRSSNGLEPFNCHRQMMEILSKTYAKSQKFWKKRRGAEKNITGEGFGRRKRDSLPFDCTLGFFFFLRISAPSPSSPSQNHHIDGCCIIRMTPLPLSLRRFPRHSDTIWVTNYPHLIFPDWTVFDIFSRCFSFKIFVEHWDIWWMS